MEEIDKNGDVNKITGLCDSCKKELGFRNDMVAVLKHDLLSDLYGKFVYDIGLKCPNCSYFYHSAYTNDRLMSRQNDARNGGLKKAKMQRSYQNAFSKFQVECKNLLENEIASKG